MFPIFSFKGEGVMKNKKLLAWVLLNLGIISLVLIALYLTGSLWSFLGLVFLFSTKAAFLAECPSCGHVFDVIKEDENENS